MSARAGARTAKLSPSPAVIPTSAGRRAINFICAANPPPPMNSHAIAYDERYNTSYLRWNRSGDRLALQRFPLWNADGADDQPVPARGLGA